MADDEQKGGSPMSDLVFVVTGLVMLVVLWYANGGPQKADLRGIFIQPPAPLGNGEAYGPQLGTTTPTSTPQDGTAADTGYPDYSTYQTNN